MKIFAQAFRGLEKKMVPTWHVKSPEMVFRLTRHRTESDKKGGHLAKRKEDGQFILRESAQCSKEDEVSFQDTAKHKFFNTNNLWVR